MMDDGYRGRKRERGVGVGVRRRNKLGGGWKGRACWKGAGMRIFGWLASSAA